MMALKLMAYQFRPPSSCRDASVSENSSEVQLLYSYLYKDAFEGIGEFLLDFKARKTLHVCTEFTCSDLVLYK